MMNDDNFYEQAVPSLIFQVATDGNKKAEFINLDEYKSKHKDKIGDKIYYVSDEKSQAGPLNILRSQGISILLLNALIDNHFIQFLETKEQDYKFTRVDSEINEHLIEKNDDVKILDAEGKDKKEELIKLFKKALGNDKITIQVESLKDEKIPAMIVLPEHMRRFQEMSAMMSEGAKAFEMAAEHSLILNTKNSIIQSLSQPVLIESSGQDKNTKQELVAQQIYYLSRLAQGNIARVDIENTLNISYELLNRQIS